MSEDTTRDDVLALLRRENVKPLTAGEITKALALRGGAAKRLQKTLNDLVRSGDIVCIRQNRYSLGDPVDLVTGRLDVTRAGNGFVADAAGGGDVFVPEEDIANALPGDVVVVRLAPESRGEGVARREGKIIRVVERSRHDIVGTLKSTGRFLHVVPMNPGYRHDFYVPDAHGANVGDRVVIRFTGWENRQLNPEAEIVEVIGPADEPTLDTMAIVRQYGFPLEFPADVIRAAEAASEGMDTPGPRVDLTDRFILTIDPEKARDFDDALSLEHDARGNRVLGVHIADVSHFVPRDSVLDREARRRGNSVYLPDLVIPMLPEQLSNAICSLQPHQDRLAFSVFLTIDARGAVVAKRFARTVIRSKLRLTYEQAYAALQPHPLIHQADGADAWSPGGSTTVAYRDAEGRPKTVTVPEEGRKLLREIHALAEQLRARRFAVFALDLDMPDCEVLIGKDGMIERIRLVSNDISHQLIEECMVAANEAVVTELANRGLPAITRAHEPPREEKIEELSALLNSMGFRTHDLTQRRNLAQFLKSIADHPLAHSARVAVLRSMNRALYSSGFEGHYALAKKFYGHFTSPIRRYPDLVLHRQLSMALLGGIGPEAKLAEQEGTALIQHGGADGEEVHGGRSTKRRCYDKGELGAIARECTDTEWNADAAERELIELKKLRYLEQQLTQKNPIVYEAVVVKCANFGMFVEVLDLQVQGLVHVSLISDQYVKYNSRNGSLQAGRETYRPGRRVKVHVIKVDFDKRRIDFAMV